MTAGYVSDGGGLSDTISSIILESELERDVRYIRLRELRRICPLYGNPMDSLLATAVYPEQSKEEPIQRTIARQSSPVRERALAAAKAYVTSLKRVVPTREIMEHIVANGIDVGGAIPLNNLSAMISTSGAFQTHGRKGWTMKDGSAPILNDSDYDQIVTETIDEFVAEDFSHTIAEIDAHRGIPPDIDRRLLARSRERIGGHMLTDEQLKALREKFTNSIRKRAA